MILPPLVNNHKRLLSMRSTTCDAVIVDIYIAMCFMVRRPLFGTGIIPGKGSNTRKKPLLFANGHGHGRYTSVTPEWTLVSAGEWPLHVIYTYIAVINL
jgi:hypothetical protein